MAYSKTLIHFPNPLLASSKNPRMQSMPHMEMRHIATTHNAYFTQNKCTSLSNTRCHDLCRLFNQLRAQFTLNKLVSLSVATPPLWSTYIEDCFPHITIYGFIHITHFFHIHRVKSQFSNVSVVKFLNLKSYHSTLHILREKCVTLGPITHIWHLRIIIAFAYVFKMFWRPCLVLYSNTYILFKHFGNFGMF